MAADGYQPSRVRSVGQLHGVEVARRNGLLDEQVLACVERGEPDRVVHPRSAEQIDKIDVVPSNRIACVAAVAREAELAAHSSRAREPQVADFDEIEPSRISQPSEHGQVQELGGFARSDDKCARCAVGSHSRLSRSRGALTASNGRRPRDGRLDMNPVDDFGIVAEFGHEFMECPDLMDRGTL